MAGQRRFGLCRPAGYCLELAGAARRDPASSTLTLGPPDLTPPDLPAPDLHRHCGRPGPRAPILSLGEYDADAKSRLVLQTNRVPGGTSELLNRAIPVELADGPMVQTLPPLSARSIAVHARVAGTLVVRDVAGGAPLESRKLDAGAATSVTLPASDHERTLAIALLPPPLASPAPAPAPSLAALRNDQPVFLDLDRDEQTSFDLAVTRGGLYRLETSGRLKTKGSIATAFIPTLDEAAGNGVGNNMLLQRYLRAGRYRLDVTAQDSAGRLGVSAAATPLATGADLLPGGTTRATLLPGQGVAFPIHIATAGRYHLDLLGDGRVFPRAPRGCRRLAAASRR